MILRPALLGLTVFVSGCQTGTGTKASLSAETQIAVQAGIAACIDAAASRARLTGLTDQGFVADDQTFNRTIGEDGLSRLVSVRDGSQSCGVTVRPVAQDEIPTLRAVAARSVAVSGQSVSQSAGSFRDSGGALTGTINITPGATP